MKICTGCESRFNDQGGRFPICYSCSMERLGGTLKRCVVCGKPHDPRYVACRDCTGGAQNGPPAAAQRSTGPSAALLARKRVRHPAGTVLSWRDRSHWSGRALSCIWCGRSTWLLDDDGEASHKVCLENALSGKKE